MGCQKKKLHDPASEESSSGLLALLVFVLILIGLGKLVAAVSSAADKSK